MPIAIKVKDIDRGWGRLLRGVKEAKNGHVKVGYFAGPEAQRPGEPVTNVELAVIHEFGAPGAKIPERSFIRSTVDANRAEYVAILSKCLKKAVMGRMDFHQAFGILGEKVKADIQNRVRNGSGIPPPNAPYTIAKKGSARPLVDSGRMIDSITYVVSGLPRRKPSAGAKLNKAFGKLKGKVKGNVRRFGKRAGKSGAKFGKKAAKNTFRFSKKIAKSGFRATKRTMKTTRKFFKGSKRGKKK